MTKTKTSAPTPYSNADKVIKYLSNRFAKLFSRVFEFDELNIIGVSHEIYDEAYALVKQETARLAEILYKKYRREPEGFEELGVKNFDSMLFIAALALAYDPVSKYVFENEWDRKRARFAEGVIASETPLSERDRSHRIMVAMTADFVDKVTFDTTVQAFKDNGTKRVRWVTSPDDKRCKRCAAMHNKIYPIDKIPPRPHIHCRCWVEEA